MLEENVTASLWGRLHRQFLWGILEGCWDPDLAIRGSGEAGCAGFRDVIIGWYLRQ